MVAGLAENVRKTLQSTYTVSEVRGTPLSRARGLAFASPRSSSSRDLKFPVVMPWKLADQPVSGAAERHGRSHRWNKSESNPVSTCRHRRFSLAVLCFLLLLFSRLEAHAPGRGYVALAVASDDGTVSRELDTGFGADRQRNMLAFAVEALKLVIEVLNKHI